MTRIPQPTAQDVRDLLAFLPKLYVDGFVPIKRVHSKDTRRRHHRFPPGPSTTGSWTSS